VLTDTGKFGCSGNGEQAAWSVSDSKLLRLAMDVAGDGAATTLVL